MGRAKMPITVQVYRDGERVSVDGVTMGLGEFKANIPTYKELGRPFNVCPACWLVRDDQVSKVQRMLE